MDLGDMPLMSLSALKQAHVVLIAECLMEVRVQLLIHLV